MDKRKQFTFYRSFWEAINGLPKKDRLPILEAVISYGLDGEVPHSLSQSQSAFFSLVKPVLDSGRKKASSGKQGGKSGKQTGSKPEANGKQTGSEKEIEKEKEKEIEIEVEVDVEGNPLPSASAASDSKLKYLSGSLGQGVVALTNQQMEDLLDRMGLDMFDHYVKKLSDFILSKGASVKSHYNTILDWYTQDCALRG